ncbi:type-F conjugative transfer system secretin TraK [Methylomonas sp. AM2-LC]|uniref:TraK domain-containing protein n=1 Tax=Methylomonas sp. AM2-LC TaxID=3153301 RepID=UPI003263E03E
MKKLKIEILGATLMIVAGFAQAQSVTPILPFISENGNPLIPQVPQKSNSPAIQLPNDLNQPDITHEENQFPSNQQGAAAFETENQNPAQYQQHSMSLQQPTQSSFQDVEINDVQGRSSVARNISSEKKTSQKRPNVLNAPVAEKQISENDIKDKKTSNAIVIKAKPGITESVIIARYKLNRISTPYSDPKVLTVDAIETKIDGSDLYIATESEVPVSLFITSESGSGEAISLQLSPKDSVSPVEIKIESGSRRERPGVDSDSAGSRWNKSSTPYVHDIKTVMQSMAKQQIPQGYALEEVTEELVAIPFCHDPELTFRTGQVLGGHDSKVIVLIAQNNTSRTIQFEEYNCANESTLAVSAWPRVLLNPGEKTEVYILTRLYDGMKQEETRPALIQ